MRSVSGAGPAVAAAVALLEKHCNNAKTRTSAATSASAKSDESLSSTPLRSRRSDSAPTGADVCGLRKEPSFNSKAEFEKQQADRELQSSGASNCSADSLEADNGHAVSSDEETDSDSTETEEEEDDDEEGDEEDEEVGGRIVKGLEPISEEEQRQLVSTEGGESSPDEESTLKCVPAWSATDSAHSSTSEMSSSEEDCAQVAQDFQWVRNSTTNPMEDPTVTKTVRVGKSVTSKPPKTASVKKQTIPTKEVSEPEEVTYGNDYVPSSQRQNDSRKTPVHFEGDSEQMGNNEYHDAQTKKSNSLQEPFPVDFSETSRNASYLPNYHPKTNLAKLPPFDKTGSLDRRKKTTNRSNRDQKCRSSITSHCPSPRHSPSRSVQLDYYETKPQRTHYDSNSSLCHEYAQPHICPCYRQELEYSKAQEEMFYNRHERQDPQRYGSSGMLSHSRHCLLGSQQEINHCCSYAASLPTPCWHCAGNRWRFYKGGSGDVEERIKRLESDKTQLQLQVAVLMEQVDAQADKMADQEKLLEERKRQLVGTEDLLQREMLGRSSLETQKLELLSVMSDLKLQLAALDRDNHELRRRQQPKPPVGPSARANVSLSAANPASPTPSPVSSDNSPRRIGNQHYSLEDLKEVRPPKTPPANYQRQVDHYASLPRQASANTPPAASVRKGVAFGKGIPPPYLQQYHVVMGKAKRPGDRSYSTPNLAETESVVIVDRTDGPESLEEDVSSLSPQPSPSLQFNKAKGIRKIFGKMKRSGSGNLDDLPGEGEFRRGGVRATAGPRLGWTSTPIATPTKQEEQRLPFVEWDCAAICAWLSDMGLECYVVDAKRWAHSGAQLIAASAHEIDKELGIKNQLHRKKLQLALLSHQANVTAVDPDLKLASRLDTAWVLRWLDDTGLPQHKEAFLAARVDGRVLHRLTMDDLATLRVTSHLHVASLRRGIQVLRSQGFEPDCLQRRSIPDDQAQVALWTNHRVMEWLRAVELSEYAPYLRGSGVHGGLIYYEPRFNAELLACLLAIPPGKTLIRRHLNTHFKELLGKDCIQEKREAEATLGYIPLTPTTKLKVVKKSQFTLKRKKSRSELEFGDLVCPLDPSKTDDAEPSPKGRGCLSGS